MKKSILRGTLIIAGASIFAKMIGVLFKTPLTGMIGSKGIGIFNLPIPLFLIFTTISIAGPPVAIAKLIAEKRELGQEEEIRKIFDVSLKLMLIIGIFISVTIGLSSKLIVDIFWGDEVFWSLLALAPAPFFLSVVSVFKGYYQGHQQMFPSALAQIVEGVGRMVVGLFLASVLLSSSISHAAAGASFGTTAGSVLAFITLIIIYIFDKNKYDKVKIERTEEIALIKKILKISVFISVGAAGVHIMSLVDNMLIPNMLLKLGYSEDEKFALVGILGNATTIKNLPLAFATAIGINLIPSISAAKLQSKGVVENKVRSGLIMIISIALPSSVGIFILARPIFLAFFPTMTTNHYLLEIFAFGVFFSMINQVFISVLQAMDHVKTPVRNIYIGAIIKVILFMILISFKSINIHAAAISSIIASLAITLFNGFSCHKLIKFKIDFKFMVVLPLFNVFVMSIVVLLSYSGLSAIMSSNRAIVGISILLGMCIYGILLIITKIVSIKSIPLLNRFSRR